MHRGFRLTRPGLVIALLGAAFVASLGCSSADDVSAGPNAATDASTRAPTDANASARDDAPTAPEGAAPAPDSAIASDGGPAPGDSAASCTPDPSGAFAVTGDVVFDPKTCLTWMKATKEGVNMNPAFPPDAVTYCTGLSLGGYDDWRVPSIDELASILDQCGTYLGNTPSGPWDPVFEVSGDGYWTTGAPSPGHICAIGSSNGGGYYKYGTDGPQRVRCVRGAGVVRHVKDCTLATGCKDW
jgi:hypothetical protein